MERVSGALTRLATDVFRPRSAISPQETAVPVAKRVIKGYMQRLRFH